jgi:hypothetical protein
MLMPTFNAAAEEKAVFEAMERGYEEAQTSADVAYISSWVEGKTREGIPPTDDEIVAELERYVCDAATLIRRGF